jgi:RAC serine/threonine-protein kinase
MAVGVALGSVISGMPACSPPPSFGGDGSASVGTTSSSGSHDVDALIQARNEAQDWLSRALTIPAARESPVMRQFLCYGANIVPPQFEGIGWINFSGGAASRPTPSTGGHGGGSPTYAAVAAGTAHPSPSARPPQPAHLDEMEMDEMFNFENDGGGESDPDEDEDEDVEYFQASNRYQPFEEPLSQSEVMEIQQEASEVEMVEDVGSLAQSLGASHLGRSLQLQKEMASYKQNVMQHQSTVLEQQSQQQGLTLLPPSAGGIGGASSSPGGIGSAMAKAASGNLGSGLEQVQEQQQPHVAGLGDSFYRTAPVSAPRLDSFKMIKVIGKGSFGKVFLVREKQTNEMFALKVLKKDNIIKRNQVEHTKTERSVLGYVKHPFIVGLNMAFQSKDKLYFVLDYCAGGELFFHLGKVGKFSEQRACFYAAEITLAIAYVHNLDIVYRDLKPENVLLDSRGHVRLTDFGLSKEGISNSSSGANSFCGTPEYLAPEILNRQGHGRAVDWWSLGALLYEMLTGLPPFYCRDREKLFEKIRRGTLDYPRYLSAKSQQILRGLLTKDPTKRLGSGPNDAEDIKCQDFFEDLNWEKLMNGEVAPPWDPQINGSMDTSQFDNEFTNMPLNSPGAFQGQGLGTTPADNVFEGFTFTDRSFYAPPSRKA